MIPDHEPFEEWPERTFTGGSIGDLTTTQLSALDRLLTHLWCMDSTCDPNDQGLIRQDARHAGHHIGEAIRFVRTLHAERARKPGTSDSAIRRSGTRLTDAMARVLRYYDSGEDLRVAKRPSGPATVAAQRRGMLTVGSSPVVTAAGHAALVAWLAAA
jgi:hypothetical protein